MERNLGTFRCSGGRRVDGMDAEQEVDEDMNGVRHDRMLK